MHEEACTRECANGDCSTPKRITDTDKHVESLSGFDAESVDSIFGELEMITGEDSSRSDEFNISENNNNNSSSLLKQYHLCGLSQVVMVCDDDTDERVRKLVPQLAQLIRGGAAVVLCHM